ncbi:MAG: V-type ATP synthase subunit I [Patescibacteria group bacterium]|nr:V-type ATP synthase subunit I [Patescibacteria group bacterium]
MAISPVAKYNLVSLKSKKEEIIELLHDFGVVQIEQWPEREETAETSEKSPEYLYAQVNFAINFLNQYQEEKPSLKEKLLAGKKEFSSEKLEKMIKEFDYQEIVKKCEDYESELNKQNSIIDKNKADKEMLGNWSSLGFIPNDEIQTEKTITLLGSVNFEAWERIMIKAKKLNNISLQKSHEENREVFFSITFYKDLEKEVRQMLTHYDFKPTQLPEIDCLPDKKINLCDKNIKKAKKEIKQINKKIKQLVHFSEKLQITLDYLSWKKEQKQALDKSINTKKTFALLFWIEKRFVKTLKNKLEKITEDFALEKMPLKKDESTPITLHNRNMIEPFESVTGVYGMPLKSEPDPTPFLAPFFFIFFGFCVSDAGYGLVMTAVMLLILKISKKPKKEMKLIRLLVLGGISTFLAGVLFGSWFGIDISSMAPGSWFREFVLTFKIMDPVNDPITVLLISLVFGLIQIMTGLIINTWWKIKKEKIKEALLGSGMWFIALLTLGLWVMTKVGFLIPASASDIMTYVLLSVAGLLILANTTKTKNIFLKLPIGIYSLYDLIGYLSDTLSYSRLLALGLATGIIAMVVNLIAGLAIEMIPIAGYLLALLILIGGHAFNIGINALGAFIHSGRLQFVEFFPKFMEGGGTRFKPFKKQAKYIRIIK